MKKFLFILLFNITALAITANCSSPVAERDDVSERLARDWQENLKRNYQTRPRPYPPLPPYRRYPYPRAPYPYYNPYSDNPYYPGGYYQYNPDADNPVLPQVSPYYNYKPPRDNDADYYFPDAPRKEKSYNYPLYFD